MVHSKFIVLTATLISAAIAIPVTFDAQHLAVRGQEIAIRDEALVARDLFLGTSSVARLAKRAKDKGDGDGDDEEGEGGEGGGKKSPPAGVGLLAANAAEKALFG